MEEKDGLPVIPFASPSAWESWLADHHGSKGVWIKYAKKGSGIASVDWEQAVEGALRFGWIDGQAAPLDERFYLQRFTPRRPRSRWSRKNVDTATRLIAEGRMAPPGLEQIERAKADGRWDAAYDSPSKIKVPPDLQREFDADPKVAEFFASLSSANRFAILYRLQEAKKPETRARRLEKFVAMLKERKTLH